MDITLRFDGPFTFTCGSNSVFHSPFAATAGIYLWTIRQRSDNTHLIHYVGEAASLAKRQRDHLVSILGLNYGIFEPEKAQDGIREQVWPGLWREKSPDGPAKLIAVYQRLQDTVLRYLSILNIFFAEATTDKQMRKHIEGCIGLNLRHNHREASVLYPPDNHIGAGSDKNHGELLISSAEVIRGLDSRIPY